MALVDELHRLANSDLNLQERVALKLALALLNAKPRPVWSEEEYLELPRKFELSDGKLIVTY